MYRVEIEFFCCAVLGWDMPCHAMLCADHCFPLPHLLLFCLMKINYKRQNFFSERNSNYCCYCLPGFLINPIGKNFCSFSFFAFIIFYFLSI